MNPFRDKKVLVFGHTGFKGSWAMAWLSKLGSSVFGFSQQLKGPDSLFQSASLDDVGPTYFGDIADFGTIFEAIENVKPDLIFNFAALALVEDCHFDPVTATKTNVLGTVNILTACKQLNMDVPIVIVTSDKCYENIEMPWSYRENDSLGGHDIYSASKASCELMVSAIRRSYSNEGLSRVVTVRAGNVIGGGDASKNRLLPEAARIWSQAGEFIVSNPKATRPWQFVLEPLAGYFCVASRLLSNEKVAFSYNFGPRPSQCLQVHEVVEMASIYWQQQGCGKAVVKSLEHGGSRGYKEHEILKLNSELAEADLGWGCVLTTKEAVDWTMSWYVNHFTDKGASGIAAVEHLIDSYCSLLPYDWAGASA